MSMFATVKNLDLRHFENVKSAVEHVGLYVGLVVFTAAGAKVSRNRQVVGMKLKVFEHSMILSVTGMGSVFNSRLTKPTHA